MKFHRLAVATALACTFGSAAAADTENVAVTVGGGPAGFFNTFDGSDSVTFAGLTGGTFYNFFISGSVGNATLTSAIFSTASGNIALAVSNGVLGGASFAGFLGGNVGQPAPFSLQLVGSTTGSPSFYSGNLSVTAVPEPGTYALMLASLGVIGFVARRRKNTSI